MTSSFAHASRDSRRRVCHNSGKLVRGLATSVFCTLTTRSFGPSGIRVGSGGTHEGGIRRYNVRTTFGDQMLSARVRFRRDTLDFVVAGRVTTYQPRISPSDPA